MATIIIPAHNEAAVIRNCLDSIVNQTDVDSIIVACNGCTDNTVETVNTHYANIDKLICLDIKKPSKTNANNEAEKHVNTYPGFYINADTCLSDDAITNIITGMQEQKLELAAPTPIIDTSTSSWLVKQYYKIWLQLPYIKAGVIATCSFVVSEQGRKRFQQFPDVINDDGYIRCQFQAHEIGNVANSTIAIKAPRDVYSLIKIKTRARLGNMQLQRLQLCTHPPAKHYAKSFSHFLFSQHWYAALAYYSIAIIIRIRAQLQLRKLKDYKWEKDLSSR